MDNRIYIITACSRPDNLFLMKYASHCGVWIVVHDSHELLPYEFGDIKLSIKGGVAGKMQINHALDYLKKYSLSGWVYVLDDDNDMHEDFFAEITKTIQRDSGKYLGYLFAQNLDGFKIRGVDPGNVKVCQIDQGQFLLHTDLIKDNRYQQIYEADGMFVEALYNENRDKFKIIPKVLSHYNKLNR